MKKNVISTSTFRAAASALFLAGLFLSAQAGASDHGPEREAVLKLNSVREIYLASQRFEALRTKTPMPVSLKASSPDDWLVKVRPEQVNMAINHFEGKKQHEIKIDGKTYYGSGKSYAYNISTNNSVRCSRDPFTGKSVDKSQALIYADASGRAFYFESEDTYRGFLNLYDRIASGKMEREED